MSSPAALRLAPLVLLLALACAACGGGEAPEGGEPTGEQLFSTQNCVTCHRADGSGNAFGPALGQVEEYWTREALAQYLADPPSHVAKDPRLTALSRNYRMQMPPVKLSEQRRLLLADHVLGLAAKQ
jgi:mono/diheme cytochrome c family protein